MTPQDLVKTATPKEALRLGFLAFGVLGFLQAFGRTDLVGAEPTIGMWSSLGISLLCLVLLEVYTSIQRRAHLAEQAAVAADAVENGTKPPGAPGP